ncbi:MAG TPA: sigma-70 family RNA polymerase sigma factor [Kofleriaceae bacterium]|nr:sigma-70 family RNA polymerase sigma factor [Kofleriaceae bacterium]
MTGANTDDLVRAFCTTWRGTPPAGLAAALRDFVERAGDAGPSMLAALGRVAPASDDIVGFVERCRAADFALAQGAAAGTSSAIRALEARFATAIAITTRRFAGLGHSEDDLLQILRDKLLVAAPGELPTIAQYNGQGSLETWLRVIATRTFIDLGRRKDRARELPAGDHLEDALQAGDLELELVKAEYRDAVARALRTAVTSLAPGDRHLLRQHLVGGLTIDQLAVALGIHRATAARRLARARDELAERTRSALAEALQLDDHELGEVLGLVLSKLDISMRTLLASRPVA